MPNDVTELHRGRSLPGRDVRPGAILGGSRALPISGQDFRPRVVNLCPRQFHPSGGRPATPDGAPCRCPPDESGPPCGCGLQVASTAALERRTSKVSVRTARRDSPRFGPADHNSAGSGSRSRPPRTARSPDRSFTRGPGTVAANRSGVRVAQEPPTGCVPRRPQRTTSTIAVARCLAVRSDSRRVSLHRMIGPISRS
jgi:hypothetical protein